MFFWGSVGVLFFFRSEVLVTFRGVVEGWCLCSKSVYPNGSSCLLFVSLFSFAHSSIYLSIHLSIYSIYLSISPPANNYSSKPLVRRTNNTLIRSTSETRPDPPLSLWKFQETYPLFHHIFSLPLSWSALVYLTQLRRKITHTSIHSYKCSHWLCLFLEASKNSKVQSSSDQSQA